MTEPIYLNDTELQNLGIDNQDIIEAIEHAIVGVGRGEVSAAPKTAVRAQDGRYMMATLSASDESGLIVVKSVLANERNKDIGLPGVNGGIMLLDSESGILKAIFDAGWITAVRTAGLSAVAAKHLANPNSSSIGLVGTGVQAESHLRAFAELFPLNSVYATGRGTQNIKRMAVVARELNLGYHQVTPEHCVRESDIVVSSVSLDSNSKPFLDARQLRSGSFATIIDQGGPWIKTAYNAFTRIYVDNVAQEKVMEKPLVDPALVNGELTDLVVNNVSYNSTDTSAFIFRGIAIGDLAVATLAYRRAIEKRV